MLTLVDVQDVRSIGSSIYLTYSLYLFLCGAIGGYILYILYALAAFIPSLAVTVRRLHDTNRSGWNILWCLLPVIGPIVLLVFMVSDSTPDNQYGPNPKNVNVTDTTNNTNTTV